MQQELSVITFVLHKAYFKEFNPKFKALHVVSMLQYIFFILTHDQQFYHTKQNKKYLALNRRITH